MPREYPIYRVLPVAPFRKYACTVVADSSAEDGFKVTRADAQVGGPDFLHDLREALRKPVRAVRGAETRHGPEADEAAAATRQTAVHVLFPGDEGYLDEAVRQVPGTYLGSVP